jgi:hypothetical protein
VDLQKSTYAEETLEAKVAFERYAVKSGVTVKHYHADNGRFGETTFKAEVLKQGQTTLSAALTRISRMRLLRGEYVYFKIRLEQCFFM